MRKNQLYVCIAVLAVLMCASLCALTAFLVCDGGDDIKSEFLSVGRSDLDIYEIEREYSYGNYSVVSNVKEEYKDKITEIVLPEGYTIRSGAFKGMKNLKKVVVPKDTYIVRGAFEGCDNLTDFVFEEGVISIPDNSFLDLPSVERVSFPSTLIYLSTDAFRYSKWYNNQPDGMIYIGTYAYAYKGEMPENTKIVIKEGTTLLADNLFSGCDELVEVYMPDSVLYMGSYLFMSCAKLQSVRFSQNITHATSFWNCPSLKEVVFPDSVKTLHSNTFMNCPRLMSVTIGKNFERFIIGWFMPVVQNCPRLVQIYDRSYDATSTEDSNGRFAGLAYYVYSDPDVGKLFETQKDTYYFINGDEKLFVDYFGDDVENFALDPDTTGIYDGAFFDSKLKSIVIPEGVTRVSISAFCGENCNIERIYFPSTIEDFSRFSFFEYYSEDHRITIEYNGTKAQWQNVIQDDLMMYSGVTVICKDATLVYGGGKCESEQNV